MRPPEAIQQINATEMSLNNPEDYKNNFQFQTTNNRILVLPFSKKPKKFGPELKTLCPLSQTDATRWCWFSHIQQNMS
jgi:hypothetical protein